MLDKPPLNSKAQKALHALLLVVLKLIDYFGPDNWPVSELENKLGAVAGTAHKALKASIDQAFGAALCVGDAAVETIRCAQCGSP